MASRRLVPSCQSRWGRLPWGTSVPPILGEAEVGQARVAIGMPTVASRRSRGGRAGVSLSIICHIKFNRQVCCICTYIPVYDVA